MIGVIATYPNLLTGVTKTAALAQSVDGYGFVFSEFARQKEAHGPDYLQFVARWQDLREGL